MQVLTRQQVKNASFLKRSRQSKYSHIDHALSGLEVGEGLELGTHEIKSTLSIASFIARLNQRNGKKFSSRTKENKDGTIVIRVQ